MAKAKLGFTVSVGKVCHGQYLSSEVRIYEEGYGQELHDAELRLTWQATVAEPANGWYAGRLVVDKATDESLKLAQRILNRLTKDAVDHHGDPCAVVGSLRAMGMAEGVWDGRLHRFVEIGAVPPLEYRTFMAWCTSQEHTLANVLAPNEDVARSMLVKQLAERLGNGRFWTDQDRQNVIDWLNGGPIRESVFDTPPDPRPAEDKFGELQQKKEAA